MKILRHCYLLVALLFAAGLGSARAQSIAWTRLARTDIDTMRVGSTGQSVTDANGNTYVYNTFRSTLQAGNFTLRGDNTLQNYALIKYDSTGTVLWAKKTYGVQMTIAVDNRAGGVYIAGTVYVIPGRTTSWDGAPFPTPFGNGGRFYGKVSAAGALQWMRSSRYGNGGIGGVLTDRNGDAYFSGSLQVGDTLHGTTMTDLSSFLFKTNSAGVVQWTRTFHTNDIPRFLPFSRLSAKPNGGFLMSFSTQGGSVYLGQGTGTRLITTTAQDNVVISSFDASGNHQWSIPAGNPRTNITDMAADTLGNFYITGGSQGSVRLGTTTVGLGFFLAKYTAGGQLVWARGEQQTPGVTNSYNYAVGWSLNPSNDGVTLFVGLTGAQYRSSVLDSLTVSSQENIVHYSPLGIPQWLLTTSPPPGSPAAPYSGFYAFTDLHTDARGNLYGIGRVDTSPRLPGTLGNPAIMFGSHTTVGSGTAIFRIDTQANTLRGMVYFDQNSNGRQDVGENSFPRPVTGILTQGSATSYTAVASDGQLQTFATPGAYTLSLATLPYYTVSQPGAGSYTGTFSGRNQLVASQNFGLAPVANQTDLRATLTPYTSARPGFVTHYRLTLENVGTTTLPSGTATLVLDSRMAYISSTPSASRTGQTLTWSYASLAPFGRNEYDVLFSLPTNATAGTVLSTTASAPVAGDVEPADNAAALAQTVVSSYDPNSIEVSYERLTPAQVAAQQPLDYTIHFQNLGTAAAANVLLSDTLDFRKLNPATLMLVAQSHNCVWSLTSLKPNTGLLTVRFLNINLPERNQDVIRSQGFVRFRVQPRTSLAVGDIVPNKAGIVFDYNAPVITNTATTTVFLATAALASHTAAAWNAYPNPATDAVTIAADLKTAGPVRLDLLDALGRTVRHETLTAPAGPLRKMLDLRGLASGFYVIRLTPPTGPASSQQLVRE